MRVLGGLATIPNGASGEKPDHCYGAGLRMSARRDPTRSRAVIATSLLLTAVYLADTFMGFGLVNVFALRPSELVLALGSLSTDPVMVRQNWLQAYDYATEVMVTNMLHRDAEEGIGAFLEKRLPDFSKF